MLPKSKRLSTEAFTEIIGKGQSFHSPFLIIRVIPSAGDSRFAASIPKKVYKSAVSRNKLKRQIYSIIKKLPIKSGYRVIVIAKQGIEKINFIQLGLEIDKIFVKSSLLK